MLTVFMSYLVRDVLSNSHLKLDKCYRVRFPHSYPVK